MQLAISEFYTSATKSAASKVLGVSHDKELNKKYRRRLSALVIGCFAQ